MKPYKPPSVVAEETLDKLVKGDAPVDKSIKPSVPMQMQPGTPKEPKTVTYTDPKALEAVIVQLQNIFERISNVETMVRTIALQLNNKPVVDDTYPATTNGGHPKLASGMVAQFIEVPTVEQLLSRAGTYKDTHGKDALTALVKSFGVKKISELSDEDRAKFMEQLR